MHRTWVYWLVLAVIGSTTLSAQQNGQLQTPPPPQVIKPKLTVASLVFTLNLINSVEIQGREVDAFLEVRKVLSDALDGAQKANRANPTDEVTLELQLPVAQNLVTLMQRARITGADADRYKQVMDAIMGAAQQQGQAAGGGQRQR
ncbi:hypothetical protein HRbin21_00707 [bacterium HR21]|nr:hypothetical protein HRbin21_00707 [bacterium HR21]